MKASLNHLFRTIWSDALNTWVAVSEITSAKGKRSKSCVLNAAALAENESETGNLAKPNRRLRLKPLALALACCFSVSAFASPVGGQVVNGSASINQVGNVLTVTNTPNAIINWQGFSIGKGEVTNFIQQSASSSILNRVVGPDPSALLGSLTSNGKVFLINPAGILVGQGARIDVPAFVASTLNLSNTDYLAGKLNFGPTLNAGAINNNGTITTPEGGSVYLVAPQIENNGIINTPKGETILAAGNTVQLIDTGTPGVTVQITGSNTTATNLGQILADSGRMGMVGAVVSNSGTLNANSLVSQGGKIFLKATHRVDAGGTISAQGVGGGNISVLADMQNGSVNVTGTLDASAPLIPHFDKGGLGGISSANGGFIETSAARVKVADTAKVTTAASMGLSGTWLIDPTDFTIAASGGNMTGATLSTSLGAGDVTILSSNGTVGTAGDVNVNDVVTWSANKLTLNARNNINLNANLNGSGTASLALEYGQGAVALGNVSRYIFGAGAQINLPAGMLNFTTLLGSNGVVAHYTVITALGVEADATRTMIPEPMTLQGMAAAPSLTGNYVLGANIDATATSGWNSGAGFTPIGNGSARFTGTFDGLGHVVSHLTINRPTNYVGLFGYAGWGSTIRNIGLVLGSVSGASDVGGLVGYSSYGIISNSYATGSVTGTGNYVGGLAGYCYGGTINSSYATGNVSGNYDVGGLVGFINGGEVGRGYINNSYATGSVNGVGDVGGLVGFGGNYSPVYISTSYALGNVSGTTDVGGLVGLSNYGTISSSYATGNVSGTTDVGGLVGLSGSWRTPVVSTSYASGNVTGTTNVGGLVGWNKTGIVTNSYWNSANSSGMGLENGTTTGSNGLTSTQMMQLSSFSRWNAATPNTISSTGGSGAVWRIYEGQTAPLLLNFLTPLTVTANNVSKAYDGNIVTQLTNASYSVVGAASSGHIPNIANPYNGAVNAGSYAPGLYSDQQGYDISFVNGTLTINAATDTGNSAVQQLVTITTASSGNPSGILPRTFKLPHEVIGGMGFSIGGIPGEFGGTSGDGSPFFDLPGNDSCLREKERPSPVIVGKKDNPSRMNLENDQRRKRQ